MDFLSKKERSRLMSKIRSKDTKPELEMARILDLASLRYDKHRKDLPGKPDFVLGNLAVFVDGSFWHGKKFDTWSHKLKPFWLQKIQNNMRRDKRVDARLRRMGYCIIHIWEEDVWTKQSKCLSRIRRRLPHDETISNPTRQHNVSV